MSPCTAMRRPPARWVRPCFGMRWCASSGVQVSVARNGTFEVVGVTRAMRQS